MIIFSIKEAFLSLARAKFATVITAITLALASLFFSMSFFLILNSDKIEKELKDKIEIRVFLKGDISKNEIQKLEKELLQDNRVSIVRFVDRETAANELKKYLKTDFTKVLGSNPLPSSFTLHINSRLNDKQINSFIKELKGKRFIDDVVYDKNEIIFLMKIISYLKLGIYIFSFVAIIISLYLILSVNRLVMEYRRKIYDTMKLFGAKLKHIRLPIFFSGMLLASLSALFGAFFVFILYYLLNKFFGYVSFQKYILEIILIYFIGAYSLGILGGIISSKKVNLKFEKK